MFFYDIKADKSIPITKQNLAEDKILMDVYTSLKPNRNKVFTVDISMPSFKDYFSGENK